jgi:magnesium chelatase accessory protein
MTDVAPPPAWRTDGGDWPNRETSRFVAAGGVRWHVQVTGTGPVVLLLHGTGAATHSWRDVLALLAEQFTVVAPDLPGHGFTSGLTSPTLPAMAAAVAALMATLDLTPALVVGHSAGAAVAVRLSIDRPIPIVALNAALQPFPGIAATLFPALAKILFINPLVPGLMALQARRPGVVARFLPKSTGSTIDQRGVELYARLFSRRDHVAGALAMMANWDLAALATDLPKLTAPLRLLYGDRDATIPPQVSRDVATKVAGATAISLGPLGHLAHEEDPASAAGLIADAAAAWGIC